MGLECPQDSDNDNYRHWRAQAAEACLLLSSLIDKRTEADVGIFELKRNDLVAIAIDAAVLAEATVIIANFNSQNGIGQQRDKRFGISTADVTN